MGPYSSRSSRIDSSRRPAEAISSFYEAAVIDAEYFGEVKLGVGTARALQGRLSEAAVHFASAQKMDQKNEKLKASLAEMTAKAEQLEAVQVDERLPRRAGAIACP